MQLIRLKKTSFVRQYDMIGYIYNQLSRKDMIVDGIGAIFLNCITRYSSSIQKIIKKLSTEFTDVSIKELNDDFLLFASKLHEDGFVVIGENEKELNEQDKLFSFENNMSLIKNVNNETDEVENSQEYLKRHFQKYPRIFRAHIELTNLCNLKCIHCYLNPDNKKNTISKELMISVLDQLSKMGTLEVIFTGGEVLLYKDLIPILEYAQKKDFSIILLTNGSLFNEKIIKKLKDLNIAFIQVSLYSMDSNIHDSITGIDGSWTKTRKNIQRLIDNNIRVEIACPILKENADSFTQVLDYYNNIGVSVSNDLKIMAGEDFSKNSISHRVEVSQIKKIINQKSQHELQPQNSINSYRDCNPNDSICGMGNSLICISYDGNFYPCPGFRLTLGNTNNPLDEIWNNSPNINFLRKISYASFSTCLNCEDVNYCTICPAKFYNESEGNLFKIDKYFCAITKAEREILKTD